MKKVGLLHEKGDEPSTEAPVNDSSNYNCSKVAKFLVG